MAAENPSLQRILIVEDEDNARKGYEALLRKWNCEVLGVASGEDALAKFPELHPQVILVDVELPGMNGLDLLRHLGDVDELTQFFNQVRVLSGKEIKIGPLALLVLLGYFIEQGGKAFVVAHDRLLLAS